MLPGYFWWKHKIINLKQAEHILAQGFGVGKYFYKFPFCCFFIHIMDPAILIM